MRLCKVLCCSFLLAALAAAQSSPSSGTGQQADQSAQNPQPPPSPLQEPPTQAQQQQQQQQQTGTTTQGRASTFDVGGSGGEEQDQDLGEVRLMTRYTQVNGNTTRSFRVQGQNDLGEFNYFTDHRFLTTGRRLQALGMFRSTDDASIDPERVSLQKAYIRIFGPRDEYILGDALVTYSRLTFNQNVKGLSSTWKLGDRWKLSSFGGIFIDRYGSLYKSLAGRPYMAIVSGARVEYGFMRNSTFGLNFASSDDQTGTLPPATLATSPQPTSNRVASLDTKIQHAGLRFDAEYAYSFTDFDTRSNSGCPNPLPSGTGFFIGPCDTRIPQNSFGAGRIGNWGARYDASYRWKKLNLRSSYVRFEPAFASVNARQVPDLQDFSFRASVDVTSWMTAEGTMRRSNDDLMRQNPFERIVWGPEARLLFHDLPFYRRGVFEIGYRHRIVEGLADTLQKNCLAHTSGPGSTCIDRYVRIPYAEFTVPVSTTFFTVGYERRQSVDRLAPGQTSNTDRFYFSLRGIYDLGGWHLNPNVRWEVERQGSKPGLDSLVGCPACTVLTNPVLFFLEHDTNRLSTAGVYVEAPKWFIVEVAFRDSSSTAASLTQNGTIFSFDPAGYSRPSYRAAVTYKILNDENKTLVFSFERNNNFYYSTLFPPHGALNPANFDERVAGVTLVYKFGKRGR